MLTTRMMPSEDGWRLDFDELQHVIDDRTRLFILCNPHNPTGRVFEKSELLEVARHCLRHDLVICSDEIHCDLILEPGLQHIPIASLDPEISQQTITLMAPSKTYNIPGLGCSFAVIANDDLRKRFKKAMDGIVPYVNVLGLTAARAAYQHGQPWLETLLNYLRNNRDLLFEAIQDLPGLHMSTVEATYLAWIDIGRLKLSQPAKWFENAGVGLSDGREFNGDGYMRLNFGCSRSLLENALNRIATAIKDLA